MFNREIKIVIFTILFLLSISVVFANDNATLDDGTLGSEDKYSIDIQNGIDQTDENGVVELNGTYSIGTTVSITKNITLNGNNDTIFDGNSGANIESSSKDLTFKNILFKNFQSGAVKTNGKTTFINCVFTGNYANFGGALDLTGTSTLIDCIFKENRGYQGGAILNKGDLTVTNCSFINNYAEDKFGAICSYHDYDDISRADIPDMLKYYGTGTVKIIDSKFENNSANNAVGAIFSSQNLIIDNTSFISNRAKFMGVILSTADLIINNSKFNKNSVYNSNNIFYLDEGLISTINSIYGKTTILNSEFIGNLANYCAISLSKTIVNLQNNVFSGNSLGTIFIGDCTSKYPKYTILDDNLKSIKLFKLTINNVVTTVFSDKSIKAVVTDLTTSKPIANVPLEASYSQSTRTVICSGITNSNGVASLPSLVGKLGTHNNKGYLYSHTFWSGFLTVDFKYTVNKIPTTVKAPKVKFKHKKSKYFKVYVKTGKKPLKMVLLKIKIDKKVHKVKTNSKGIAKFNTKKLKVGKHKVRIYSGNVNYAINGKSVIKIKR
ncbi:hypothetical protein [Methanobrevibacter sp.]|uniref:hypothetical protein n=1 Tax=Methanobrevibacter sp. TaxID=66852 RepID=UPI0025EE5A37|nr:hypothetical protein [Methanobrevibacter sp.]MBR4447949.1 hypothetical protein [Methanobrevibacter sp.]